MPISATTGFTFDACGSRLIPHNLLSRDNVTQCPLLCFETVGHCRQLVKPRSFRTEMFCPNDALWLEIRSRYPPSGLLEYTTDETQRSVSDSSTYWFLLGTA